MYGNLINTFHTFYEYFTFFTTIPETGSSQAVPRQLSNTILQEDFINPLPADIDCPENLVNAQNFVMEANIMDPNLGLYNCLTLFAFLNRVSASTLNRAPIGPSDKRHWDTISPPAKRHWATIGPPSNVIVLLSTRQRNVIGPLSARQRNAI